MAVAPTGAIYKSLIFDGEDSRSYGVYITGEAVYNAPERDVEMVTIPGRNGTYALDNGRFENIEVSYPAGIFADTEADYREAISDFRNFLCSRKGYVRLQDEYNPNEYRMAVYKSGLEVEPAMLRAGEFKITFDCKPQRFLTSGETAITIGEWRDTETVTGDIVEVENPDEILGVKSLSVALSPIQDLHGYDKPWSGGNGKNKLSNGYSAKTGAVSYSDGVITFAPSSATQYITLPFVGDGETTYTWSFDAVSSENGAELRYDGQPDAGASGLATDFKVEVGTAKTRFTRTGILPTTNESMRFFRTSALAKADTATITISNIQIEEGSTATTYEPYTNICPISGRTECVTEVSGVNVWDEEWEVGGIATSTGVPYSSTTSIRSKNYISVKPNTEYYIAQPSRVTGIYLYDADKGFILYDLPGLSKFTTPSNAQWLRLGFQTSYGNVYNHDISINYPSTDTEYHAYDGDTYTTDLGRTVYGGTLDVVSGVLTVTDAMVDMGDLAWVINGAIPNGMQYACTTLTDKAVGETNFICSAYETHTPMQTIGMICGRATTKTISVNSSITNLNDFIASVTGQTIVYELATPQTYQLSPQEVALLKGTNNVWSDSGDITLEYGQLPNLLINPTLFEASPMIEVWGYGTVVLNGYTVELENAVLGPVTIFNGDKPPLDVSVSVASPRYNIGDEIIIPASSRNEVALSIDSNLDYSTYILLGATNVSGGSVGRYNDRVNRKWGVEPTVILSEMQITSGVDSSKTDTLTCDVKYARQSSQQTEYTTTLTVNVTRTYNASSNTITWSFSSSDTGSKFDSPVLEYCWCGDIIADSTVPITGNPTYIDCDLGEAYKIEGGEVVSLNTHIDLGSKLPTLAVGENEITFDNTFTEVKVVTRWWKI